MILTGKAILELCSGQEGQTDFRSMITNFVGCEVRENGFPSYGLTSEGYDVRLRPEGLVICDKNRIESVHVSDPEESAFLNYVPEGHTVTIPPHSMLMGRTENGFNLPGNVLMAVFTKSSFARCGISLNTTKAVPGWQGAWLVVEITNNAPFPVSFDLRGGVASLVFFQTDGQSKLYKGLFSDDQGYVVPAR